MLLCCLERLGEAEQTCTEHPPLARRSVYAFFPVLNLPLDARVRLLPGSGYIPRLQLIAEPTQTRTCTVDLLCLGYSGALLLYPYST
jgi:hypothetical protein